MALAYYEVLKGGGFTTGGTNFDSKLRRQSTDPDDLLIAHISAMDCCAQGLKAAARLMESREILDFVDNRYTGWKKPEAQEMLKGKVGLDDLAKTVVDQNINPKPVSGKQEFLENVVNRHI